MAKDTSVASLGDEQLIERLAEEKDRLFKLRIQLATGQLQNTAAINECRKSIARVKTVIRQREMAEKA